MEKTVYELRVAGRSLYVSFLDPQTRYHLRPVPRKAEGKDCEFSATPELIELGRRFLPPDSSDAFVEYRCLISLSARRLLRERCCVFHAAAFRWQGHAWLLTAPSGTGKTTQFLNWRRLFPGEIEMISGDMPVLEAREEGNVMVHPSPWNGKENYCGAPASPLGGLVLLEQGPEERIVPLAPHDAVLPLLRQFMVIPENEEDVRQLSSILEQLLTAVPGIRFVNRGGDASTRLLRETLSDFLGKRL